MSTDFLHKFQLEEPSNKIKTIDPFYFYVDCVKLLTKVWLDPFLKNYWDYIKATEWM